MREFFGWFFWGSATAFAFGITVLGFMYLKHASSTPGGLVLLVLGGGLLSACLVKVVKRLRTRPDEITPVPENDDRPIIGNKDTGIYHMPGSKVYSSVSQENRVLFWSEEEAKEAGYRRSRLWA